MNSNKARDFFSSYYEGTLDGGLRQSLEVALREDANLHADYSAFVETIRELDALKYEEIEIPIYLSDRIATRLEAEQSKTRFGVPAWTNWIRGLAFAGLAAVAIIGALPLLSSHSNVGVAGALPGGSNLDQIQYKHDGSKLTLLFQPSASKTVVVTSASSNKEIQRFNMEGQRLECPIENPLSHSAAFKIQVLGDKAQSIVVVPGHQVTKAKAGSGSVQEMALALADHYQVPVVIDAADVTRHVTWTFSASDALSAANQALSNEPFAVDKRQEGMIRIAGSS
jgi:hypothetical protein